MLETQGNATPAIERPTYLALLSLGNGIAVSNKTISNDKMEIYAGTHSCYRKRESKRFFATKATNAVLCTRKTC